MIRSRVLSDEQIKKIVNEYLDRGVALFESQRSRETIFEDPERRELVSGLSNRLDQMIESDEGLNLLTEARRTIAEDARKQLARRKGPDYPLIAEFADFFLKKNNIQLDNDSIDYEIICNELLKADIRLRSIITAHINGDYETDYDVEQRGRKKSTTLSELIELYEKDKMDKWTDHSRFHSSHRQILHILGDIPLDHIDRHTSLMLREALKEYPRKLQSKDMTKPWKELAKLKKERLADASQRFILSEYSTLIKYAKKHDMGIKGDPASELLGPKDAITREKIRSPYTTEELTNLIRVLAKVDREKEPEIFWLPLLLLYTGARSNEICMLRCVDIEKKGNVWLIYFKNDEKHFQRTKNKKDRHAPIHQDLIDIGFIDFVQRQIANGCDRLFCNLIKYRDKWNIYIGKDFNRTFKLKFLPGYTEKQLKEKDLHTFRTTLISWFVRNKDLMTVSNISILQSIIGHFEKYEISFIMSFLESAKLLIEDYGGGFGKEVEQNELLQRLDYCIDLTPLKISCMQ